MPWKLSVPYRDQARREEHPGGVTGYFLSYPVPRFLLNFNGKFFVGPPPILAVNRSPHWLERRLCLGVRVRIPGYLENFPCCFCLARLVFRCPNEASFSFLLSWMPLGRCISFSARWNLRDRPRVRILVVRSIQTVSFWRNFLETVWQPFPVDLPVSFCYRKINTGGENSD